MIEQQNIDDDVLLDANTMDCKGNRLLIMRNKIASGH